MLHLLHETQQSKLCMNSRIWNSIFEETLARGKKGRFCHSPHLKVDMPILTCIFFTFNWLTLTSEMHFVKFHPEVASCLLSRDKVCTPGDEAIIKIHKLFSGIAFNFTLFVISPKLQRIWSWNFGIAIRKIWAFIWYQKIYLLWECDWHKVL